MDAPDTKVPVTDDEAAQIRNAVQNLDGIDRTGHKIAQPEDAEDLLDLLADPRVNGPLYTIPNDVDLPWVQNWIAQHLKERDEGVGALFITRGPSGTIDGFSDLQIWPDLAAAELGGGLRPDIQGKSRGGSGAADLFVWMFQDLGVKLLAMTCAEDNIRTQKLLTRIGFTQGKSRISVGPDGNTRPSLYFEMLRPDLVRQVQLASEDG